MKKHIFSLFAIALLNTGCVSQTQQSELITEDIPYMLIRQDEGEMVGALAIGSAAYFAGQLCGEIANSLSKKRKPSSKIGKSIARTFALFFRTASISGKAAGIISIASIPLRFAIPALLHTAYHIKYEASDSGCVQAFIETETFSE